MECGGGGIVRQEAIYMVGSGEGVWWQLPCLAGSASLSRWPWCWGGEMRITSASSRTMSASTSVHTVVTGWAWAECKAAQNRNKLRWWGRSLGGLWLFFCGQGSGEKGGSEVHNGGRSSRAQEPPCTQQGPQLAGGTLVLSGCGSSTLARTERRSLQG
jgi:hypothetical protein